MRECQGTQGFDAYSLGEHLSQTFVIPSLSSWIRLDSNRAAQRAVSETLLHRASRFSFFVVLRAYGWGFRG